MKGTVLFGMNNIFNIQADISGETFECRIKGKILKDTSGVYNPLAPGDRVEFEEDRNHKGKGMIETRLERKNSFSRWNKKRNSPQTLAANLDLLVCVSSPVLPPFRPRFIDRALISAERGGVTVLILMNKIDQTMNDMVVDRLDNYRKLGFDVMYCSAETGEGIDLLKERIAGKTAAFIGQSGVGKSTILNLIDPKVNQRTAEVSKKYSRGKHTTCYSLLVERPEGGGIIDTPGVRELLLYDVGRAELQEYFPEMEPYFGKCGFNTCTHLHEPGCAVLKALEEGKIHRDRYESYVRIMGELKDE